MTSRGMVPSQSSRSIVPAQTSRTMVPATVPATTAYPSVDKVPTPVPVPLPLPLPLPLPAAAPIVSHVPKVVPEHSSRPHDLAYGAVKPITSLPGAGRNTRSFFSSDDIALDKQILATHAAEYEDLNVKPVLAIVEDILRHGKPFTGDAHDGAQIQAHLNALDDKVFHSPHQNDKGVQSPYHETVNLSSDISTDIVEFLAFPISKISCEIVCKSSAGGEAHSVTMDLLRSLSSYSWDAKVVITFAAFSINYGEFWLVQHLQTKNSLAKNIATLKDLPNVMLHDSHLKNKFEEVLNLLNAVLKVTHCIIEYKELPIAYISHQSPEFSSATAHIPTAVYWIIRSLLACASILLNLIGSGHEYITSTAESWELSNLAHKLSVILDHLQNKMIICKELVERKMAEDDYERFKVIMAQSHMDNMKVLKAMIHSREDQRPIYDGSKGTNERIEVLRMKYVLLLITDLEIPHEELNVLHMIYNQSAMRHQYEVLWLPIVGPANTSTRINPLQESEFYNLRNNQMPWYSVDNPSLVKPVAIRYIREIWKFVHMPMLVVLDPHGKPINLDALPMMWIWGSSAFPFSREMESSLWVKNDWNIELLLDVIDPRTPEWIRDNKVICLYGGDDIEWIGKFTRAARKAATDLNVSLEMLYVGKRNPRAKVQRCHEIIDRDGLSHIFSLKDYYDYVWYFWVRLWSMWNSKKQLGRTIEDDRIMQEIMDVLTFDSSEQGWAIFSRGKYEMTKGNGDIVLPVLENYQSWGYKVDNPDKFVSVLDQEMRGTHPEHHCSRLILPGHAGYIPERVVCAECGKIMDKYVMYRCCTD